MTVRAQEVDQCIQMEQLHLPIMQEAHQSTI